MYHKWTNKILIITFLRFPLSLSLFNFSHIQIYPWSRQTRNRKIRSIPYVHISRQRSLKNPRITIPISNLNHKEFLFRIPRAEWPSMRSIFHPLEPIVVRFYDISSRVEAILETNGLRFGRAPTIIPGIGHLP